MKNELIDQIVNAAWLVKMRDSEYKPSNNFSISVDTIISMVIRTNNENKINGMIYYSYWLVLGCTDYE